MKNTPKYRGILWKFEKKFIPKIKMYTCFQHKSEGKSFWPKKHSHSTHLLMKLSIWNTCSLNSSIINVLCLPIFILISMFLYFAFATCFLLFANVKVSQSPNGKFQQLNMNILPEKLFEVFFYLFFKIIIIHT